MKQTMQGGIKCQQIINVVEHGKLVYWLTHAFALISVCSGNTNKLTPRMIMPETDDQKSKTKKNQK